MLSDQRECILHKGGVMNISYVFIDHILSDQPTKEEKHQNK